MTDEHAPESEPSPEFASARGPRSEDPTGVPISPTMIAVVALIAGLGGGYLLFGRPKAATPPPVVPLATAIYAPDASATEPKVVGKMAVKSLKSLEEWDALDPFDGGFPLPPEDWTAPLLALNPPIPVAATVPATDGGTPLAMGGGGTATPPPRIYGDLPNLLPMRPPSLGAEVVPSDPSGLPTGAESGPTSGAILIGVTLNGVNLDAAKATVAALANKYAGASRTFTHMGVEGDVEAEGVLLLVAPSDVEKALSDVRKLGQSTGEDRSDGSTRARQTRLSSIFSSRLATLRKRREELLVQFLEDADPIKNLDAAIDREARALGAVRLTGATDRLAAIRILLKP